MQVVCAHCESVFDRPQKYITQNAKRGHARTFCSRTCQHNGQRWASAPWTRSYRARAIRAFGAKCFQCGYGADEQMLDVDHVDNNRNNSELTNLQVLCVWCHAVKTRRRTWHPWSPSSVG